jgi:hypothetical protein
MSTKYVTGLWLHALKRAKYNSKQTSSAPIIRSFFRHPLFDQHMLGLIANFCPHFDKPARIPIQSADPCCTFDPIDQCLLISNLISNLATFIESFLLKIRLGDTKAHSLIETNGCCRHHCVVQTSAKQSHRPDIIAFCGTKIFKITQAKPRRRDHELIYEYEARKGVSKIYTTAVRGEGAAQVIYVARAVCVVEIINVSTKSARFVSFAYLSDHIWFVGHYCLSSVGNSWGPFLKVIDMKSLGHHSFLMNTGAGRDWLLVSGPMLCVPTSFGAGLISLRSGYSYYNYSCLTFVASDDISTCSVREGFLTCTQLNSLFKPTLPVPLAWRPILQRGANISMVPEINQICCVYRDKRSETWQVRLLPPLNFP